MRRKAMLEFLALTVALGTGMNATAEDLAKKLLGTWKLVSTEQRLVDGTRRPSPLYGPDGVGYLVYSDHRGVHAHLGAGEALG